MASESESVLFHVGCGGKGFLRARRTPSGQHSQKRALPSASSPAHLVFSGSLYIHVEPRAKQVNSKGPEEASRRYPSVISS